MPRKTIESDDFEEKKVSMEDIKTYRSEIKNFTSRREGGVVIPLFEQFAEKIGAARILKNGMVVVKDVGLFDRWVKVRDSVEDYDAFKNDEMRRLFPQEMKKFRDRFAKLRDSVTSLGLAKKQ